MPFFSICIPVYKNVDYLKRLLETIFIQTFTDFEVVITDDSPDNVIFEFIQNYYPGKNIRYFKNKYALGTPENWNECIRKANGSWIKLMHDDDWFFSNQTLHILFETINKSYSDFYFSAYNNVYLDQENRTEFVRCPIQRWKRVINFPPNLYARNIIGPPSVTLVKNDTLEVYDNRLKWLVDIDFYIRIFKKASPVYINQPLVCVGVSNEQVTTYTHNKPGVEIPEGLILLSKVGENAFDHVLFFDAWWRLLRNLSIRGLNDFRKYTESEIIPSRLIHIINFQNFIPLRILKFGFLSKPIMFICFAINKVATK